jgi:hypothetical protein
MEEKHGERAKLAKRTKLLPIVALFVIFVVAAWPPTSGRSLAVKAVNWGVDPWDQLPVFPPQLGMGQGDDPEAVELRDAMVHRYDTIYNQGGWIRKRLELKVARDPFDPTTERQLLLVACVLAAYAALRAGRSPSE